MKLGMLGGDEAIRALIGTLDNDYEDLIVRARSAKMLGKMGDHRAIGALIRALDAPGYQTPLFAAEALGNIGDQRAVDALRILVDTASDRLQETARVALDRLGYLEQVGDDNTPQPQPEL